MSDKDIYQQLSESVGFGESRLLPEIIKKMADSKEAEILLAASPPATAGELAEKTVIPETDVDGMLEALFMKGLIFKSRKNDAIRYYRARHIVQLHDASILTPNISKDILAMWKEFDHNEWPGYHELIKGIIPKPMQRVIPVNITVTPESQILAYEDVKHIVERSEKLAVVNCTCRILKGDCGKSLDVCIQIDNAADYAIERGTGREITREDAIDILKKCEEEGLVHVTNNSRSGGNLICNCCDDCCINWPGALKNDKKFVAPSRFTAVVDADDCTACEICMDRCYFDAISMDGEAGTALINEANCMGCGLCLVTCEVEAITLKESRSEDFVQD